MGRKGALGMVVLLGTRKLIELLKTEIISPNLD